MDLVLPPELWVIIFSKMKPEQVINLGLISFSFWYNSVRPWINITKPVITTPVCSRNFTDDIGVDWKTRTPKVLGRIKTISARTLLLGPCVARDYIVRHRNYRMGDWLMRKRILDCNFVFWITTVRHDSTWLTTSIKYIRKEDTPILFRVAIINSNVDAVKMLTTFIPPKINITINEDWLCCFFSGNKAILKCKPRETVITTLRNDPRTCSIALCRFDVESLKTLQHYFTVDETNWITNLEYALLTNDEEKIRWFMDFMIEREIYFVVWSNETHNGIRKRLANFCIKYQLSNAIQILDESNMLYSTFNCLVALNAVNDESVYYWGLQHGFIPNFVDWNQNLESIEMVNMLVQKTVENVGSKLDAIIDYLDHEMYKFNIQIPLLFGQEQCFCNVWIDIFSNNNVPLEIISHYLPCKNRDKCLAIKRLDHLLESKIK